MKPFPAFLPPNTKDPRSVPYHIFRLHAACLSRSRLVLQGEQSFFLDWISFPRCFDVFSFLSITPGRPASAARWWLFHDER